MSPIDKIVDFKKYCETCKDKDLDEVKDSCNDCLNNPANEDSHKPLFMYLIQILMNQIMKI